MALWITLVSGQELKVDVPTDRESESATELREGKTEWVGVSENVWVRRNSVVKIEIRGTTRGF